MTTDAPTKPTGRTTTTVRVTNAMYDRLWRMRQPRETFDDVLRRLLTLHDLQEGPPDEPA